MVSEVSEARIKATIEKLDSFGTRNTMSNPDDPVRGVGAARQWILEEMKSYSPKLQVRFDKYRVKKQGQRIFKDVDLWNVVAVLPGTKMPETQILVSGHYDTLNLGTRPAGARRPVTEATAPAGEALRATRPQLTPGGFRKERGPAGARRLRRRQRHRRRDGTGARDEPVRIRQDAGLRGLRRRGAGADRQLAAGRQSARKKTR